MKLKRFVANGAVVGGDDRRDRATIATPDHAVNGLNGVFGSPAGARATYAKSFYLAGDFRGRRVAAPRTSGEPLNGEPMKAGGCFSGSGGNPKILDSLRAIEPSERIGA